MASTVLYYRILYLSVAALLIMASIVRHRTWGVTCALRTRTYHCHSYITPLLLTSYLHYLLLSLLRAPSRYLEISIRAFGLPLVRYLYMYRGQTHHRSSTGSRELPEVGAIGLVIAGARIAMVMETTEDTDCPPMGMSCGLVQWTLSIASRSYLELYCYVS